jgi:hypothetical protein
MSQILNEIKMDYDITTPEGVYVKITGVPTRLRHFENGEEFQTHSFAVALRLEALVKAIVEQDPTPGRTAEHEFA